MNRVKKKLLLSLSLVWWGLAIVNLGLHRLEPAFLCAALAGHVCWHWRNL